MLWTSRLMIGSDWPVCMVAASYEQTVDLVKDYLNAYPPEERAAVLVAMPRSSGRLKPR